MSVGSASNFLKPVNENIERSKKKKKKECNMQMVREKDITPWNQFDHGQNAKKSPFRQAYEAEVMLG